MLALLLDQLVQQVWSWLAASQNGPHQERTTPCHAPCVCVARSTDDTLEEAVKVTALR